MYTLEHIVEIETALMRKVIERNGQIRQLLAEAREMRKRIETLEEQLQALTGESIKEDEHGADTSPR